MLKQKLIRVFSIISMCIGFSAVATAQKPAPAHIDSSLKKSLLWEIKGKGIRTSYLFGTIHLIPSKDFFLTEQTQKAFGKSKQLVMEMDISNQMAMAMQMMALAPMKKNQKLSDLLAPEDYSFVKKYFEENLGMNGGLMGFELLETWKPMLLQTMLFKDGMGINTGDTKSYEMELAAMAKEKKMTLGGLETMEDQMGIFEQIPYKDQAADLLKSLREMESGSSDGDAASELAKIVAFYTQQDIEGMVAMTDTEYANIENANDILLGQRNRKWISKIGEFAAKKTTFFAVGAGHLAGDNGVIKLLIKEGYKLTPLH